jgi:peptidoglycan hydrolase-like protein with peptidoglycan-binding domain
MSGSAVSELQHFLAEDTNIYPEGTVTGYFDSLTAKAVQRFQVKEGIRYSPEVPITDTGYGIVGPQTHAAISLVCSSPSVISTLSSAISPYAPTPGTISGEPYEIDVATYTGYASAQIPWKTITDQSVIQKLYADLYALPPLPPANDCPAWSENSVSTELVFYFNYSPSIDSNINYVDAQYWAGGCNVRIQSGAIFEEASLGNFDAKVEEAVGL